MDPEVLRMGKVSSQYGVRLEMMRASHGEKDAMFSKTWRWHGDEKNAGTFVVHLRVGKGCYGMGGFRRIRNVYLVNARAGPHHTSFGMGSGVKIWGTSSRTWIKHGLLKSLEF